MDIPFLFFKLFGKEIISVLAFLLEILKPFLNEEHVHLGFLRLFAWFPACIKVGQCTVV